MIILARLLVSAPVIHTELFQVCQLIVRSDANTASLLLCRTIFFQYYSGLSKQALSYGRSVIVFIIRI